ncbi:MAG: hypothetical protein V4733_03655 [Verrucomicrobiota bacterium]
MQTNSQQTTTNIVIPDNIEEIIAAYFEREAEKIGPEAYLSIYRHSVGGLAIAAANWSHGLLEDIGEGASIAGAIADHLANKKASRQKRLEKARRELAQLEAEEVLP